MKFNRHGLESHRVNVTNFSFLLPGVLISVEGGRKSGQVLTIFWRRREETLDLRGTLLQANCGW
jgi:hypothetical protein